MLFRSTKSDLLSEKGALKRLLESVSPLSGCEEINLIDALGRINSKPLIAHANVPDFDNSAMDGYAVASRDINPDAETCLEISQRITAGQCATPLKPGSAARIFTGAPIPPGADTVVMQENCREQDGQVFIQAPVTPGMHIRKAGEDIPVGHKILDAGTLIRPQEMGLAASLGCSSISVFRRVRVSILITGNELVVWAKGGCMEQTVPLNVVREVDQTSFIDVLALSICDCYITQGYVDNSHCSSRVVEVGHPCPGFRVAYSATVPFTSENTRPSGAIRFFTVMVAA